MILSREPLYCLAVALSGVRIGAVIHDCATQSDCDAISEKEGTPGSRACEKYKDPTDPAKYVWQCTCRDGFYGQYCKDKDECELRQNTCNDETQNCINTVGSYKCVCKAGFIKTGSTCQDINECSIRGTYCGPLSLYSQLRQANVCVNDIGTYRCECNNGGFEFDPKSRSNPQKCRDHDECTADSHACDPKGGVCENTPGDYKCTCKEGFEEYEIYGSQLTSKHVCEDIDECRNERHLCVRATSTCQNMRGGYRCACKDGYMQGSTNKICVKGTSSGNSGGGNNSGEKKPVTEAPKVTEKVDGRGNINLEQPDKPKSSAGRVYVSIMTLLVLSLGISV